jgi:hypothetical protein
MTWEGKFDWKSHDEITQACSFNDREELSHMLGRHWTSVPIKDINNMIRQFDKELLQHSIDTSVAAFNNIK